MISRPSGDGDFEVGGAADAVELVEVVRRDADVDEPLAQVALGVDRVVDAAQQHGLVEQHDAGAAEAVDGGGDLGVEFAGVVGVQHHDGRQPRAGEPGEQLVGHARGDHDRHARVNAQPREVRDRRELVDQRGEPAVGRGERIAAAEDDFVDRRVRRAAPRAPAPTPRRPAARSS